MVQVMGMLHQCPTWHLHNRCHLRSRGLPQTLATGLISRTSQMFPQRSNPHQLTVRTPKIHLTLPTPLLTRLLLKKSPNLKRIPKLKLVSSQSSRRPHRHRATCANGKLHQKARNKRLPAPPAKLHYHRYRVSRSGRRTKKEKSFRNFRSVWSQRPSEEQWK